MSKTPKLAEVAPGEIRTVCQGCGKVVGKTAIWCSECQATHGRRCKECGAPTRASSQICRKCQGYGSKGRPRGSRSDFLHEGNRKEVEKLWEQGLSGAEIAKVLKIPSKAPGSLISRARNLKGWNLPVHNPHAVETARIAREARAKKQKA